MVSGKSSEKRYRSWAGSPWLLNLALCVAAAAWILAFGNPLEGLEMSFYDQVLRLRSSFGMASPVDGRIFQLDITEEDVLSLHSLESEYAAVARIIRQATELGAEVIVFDVIFARGDELVAKPILEAIKGNRQVVLAEGFYRKPGETGLTKRYRSFPFLEGRHRPSGIINVEADRDGVHRRYQYVSEGPDGPEPSLALAAYLALQGIRWDEDVTFPHKGTVRWEELSPDGTKLVARELERAALLDFRIGWMKTGPASFPYLTLSELDDLYSASARDRDTAAGRGKSKPLAGKAVIVSYVASGIVDLGPTPLGKAEPLVHMHCTALNDLIQRSSNRRAPRCADALLVASLLLFGLGASRCRTKNTLVLLWFAGVVLLLAIGIALVVGVGWVVSGMLVVALWKAGLVAELGRRHTLELIERLRLRATMRLYFSPRVIKKILSQPGSMEPQQAELTVLLSDLRNFTTITEKYGARSTFDLINRVMGLQTEVAFAEDGSLENTVGDQFLAYWGAPEPQPDAADRALRAAMKLIEGMEKLRGELSPGIERLFGYGVALHAGTGLVGNKGSLRRLEYGLLGDLVNSAARIESLTKFYGVVFLITQNVYLRLTKPPRMRLIDRVILKGKSTHLELIEVEHPLTGSGFAELSVRYERAFEKYGRGNFGDAFSEFARLAEQYGDRPSEVMARRCGELKERRPAGWNGIYKFETK